MRLRLPAQCKSLADSQKLRGSAGSGCRIVKSLLTPTLHWGCADWIWLDGVAVLGARGNGLLAGSAAHVAAKHVPAQRPQGVACAVVQEAAEEAMMRSLHF